MNWAQRSVSPTRATVIYTGEPVWAGIFGRIAGERLPLLALVVAVVKLVLGVLVIALFENSMARLRFCATSRVTWAGFGFAFLAFVSLLVA
jgi:formate hydrogenlyase subunit 4